jgi:hypothetical protein
MGHSTARKMRQELQAAIRKQALEQVRESLEALEALAGAQVNVLSKVAKEFDTWGNPDA